MRAVLAGLFFGVWPLMMSRSGLGGNLSSLVLALVMLVCIFPFAFGHLGDLSDAHGMNWMMAITAGVFGAAGILLFNGVLAKATSEQVSALFVLTIIVQTIVPAVYQVVMTGGITPLKLLGFTFAAIAATLLLL